MRGKRVKQLEGKIRKGGKLVSFWGKFNKGRESRKWVGQLVGDLI